ncbi:MAG: YHS domain-containing protein [Pyrinomonadaceae bacterium]|nr:YHS domain-containing protein [Pyrinomonadaceae bacterium]
MSNYTDPICGMSVSPETAQATAVRNDEVYFFCSKRCKQLFSNQTSENRRQGGKQTDKDLAKKATKKAD